MLSAHLLHIALKTLFAVENAVALKTLFAVENAVSDIMSLITLKYNLIIIGKMLCTSPNYYGVLKGYNYNFFL